MPGRNILDRLRDKIGSRPSSPTNPSSSGRSSSTPTSPVSPSSDPRVDTRASGEDQSRAEWQYRPAPAPPTKGETTGGTGTLPRSSIEIDQGSAPRSPRQSHDPGSRLGDAKRRSRVLDPDVIPSRSASLRDPGLEDLARRAQGLSMSTAQSSIGGSVGDNDATRDVGGKDVGAADASAIETGEPIALQRQREEMAQSIAAGARANRHEVSEEGREVFGVAGMRDKLDQRGEVEVRTEWMKPVVQETIIIKEHTEVTEIIDREIHKHHIYPMIQPISDPDPIILEPRHRIFSGLTGKWHEVVGDDAAIEILGIEVFYGGPKEVREERAPALPPIGGMGDDTSTSRYPAGEAGGEGEGGEYSHRVIERDGTGGKMGQWKALVGGGSKGGEGNVRDDRMIGQVDSSSGKRTFGVAI